jgi:hypothetical protein
MCVVNEMECKMDRAQNLCRLTNYYCIATVSYQADSRHTDTVSLYARS